MPGIMATPGTRRFSREPIDVARHDDGAMLDAAMVLGESGIGSEAKSSKNVSISILCYRQERSVVSETVPSGHRAVDS
jgi:hypothetical protein